MGPKLKRIPQKQLIGLGGKMFINDYAQIVRLWKRFMPKHQNIAQRTSNEFIAVQDYTDFNDLNKPFNIYATVEVSSSTTIPHEMVNFIIPEGDYAIFRHKGMNASATYQRILTKWLPNSGYEIDQRPHFQVMGEAYKNGRNDSEEDFYVPIQPVE